MSRAGCLWNELRALPAARPVLAALAGDRSVHVVGGAVRDLLLDRAPAELDLVVEGEALPVAERAAARLGGEVVAYDRFGTATVRADEVRFDVASARRERYPAPGALPEVELGVPLTEDLARRDFTANAIAVRLADGAVTDHPGALADVAGRRLRVLHDASFADDPTRLLRLARYGARLGFSVEPATAELAERAVRDGAVDTVSGPRLGAELRLLCDEPQPAAVAALAERGLGAAVLGAGFAVDAALVERALDLRPPDVDAGLLALAAACLDVEGVAGRLAVLGWRAEERDAVAAAAGRARAVAAALGGAETGSALRAALRREGPLTVALAGALGGHPERARKWLGEMRHVRPAIGGDDLVAAGVAGPAVGRGLDAALDALLDGRASDREAQLAAALAAARET